MTIETRTINLLAIGDTHFRETCPLCRSESSDELFIRTQLKKWNQAMRVAERFNAIVVHSGDLFHKPELTYKLFRTVYEVLPKKMIGVKGNHDTKQGETNSRDTAWDVLVATKNIISSGSKDNVIDIRSLQQKPSYDIGMTIKLNSDKWTTPDICYFTIEWDSAPCIDVLVIHRLVTQGLNDEKYMKGLSIERLLNDLYLSKKISTYPDIVITGDNHRSFYQKVEKTKYHYTNKTTWHINPGCMTRQSVNENHYLPHFYMIQIVLDKHKNNFNIKNKEIQIGEFPFKLEYAVSTEKQRRLKLQTNFINTFIESMDEDPDYTLNFINNIKHFLHYKCKDKNIRKIINEAIQEESTDE